MELRIFYEKEVCPLLASCEGNQKKANQELEKLISNLEMIMDDLKGVEVDVNL